MTGTFPVTITGRREIATQIVKLELCAPSHEPLPAFAPGAHIDLHLPNGLTRQYSLINDGTAPTRYEIAVARARDSRGGSSCVHDSLAEGMTIGISAPRNHFALQPGYRRVFFIAGGIGITPIYSMIRHCEQRGLAWQLLYLARERSRAAFADELEALSHGRVRFHFDDDAGCHFDFDPDSLSVEPGTPIYCCGPEPVMNAVSEFSKQHPDNPAHFEWFKAAPHAVQPGEDQAFDVLLNGSKKIFRIPADRSILDVLEENGLDVPCSCREGMCRTCEATVLDGVPDHRDYVLSDAERAGGRSMMLCVSRAKTARLVLDL